MSDFSALNTPVADIKEPPVFPDGRYLATLTKVEFGQAGENDTDFVDMTFRVVEPLEDQDLSEFDLSVYNLTKRQWVSDKNVWYVQQDLHKISPDVIDRYSTIMEGYEMAQGADTIIRVGPATRNNDTGRRKEIKFFETLEG